MEREEWKRKVEEAVPMEKKTREQEDERENMWREDFDRELSKAEVEGIKREQKERTEAKKVVDKDEQATCGKRGLVTTNRGLKTHGRYCKGPEGTKEMERRKRQMEQEDAVLGACGERVASSRKAHHEKNCLVVGHGWR